MEIDKLCLWLSNEESNLNDTRNVEFIGKIIQVEVRHITLPNGHEMEIEVVHHPGGAAVVALNEKQEICLLKQYRSVFDDWLWELPAGKRDHQEPPLETAKRELVEEAGVKGGQWQELGSMISSPGVFSERVYLYLATGLTHVGTDSGIDEVIQVHWIPVEEAYQWAFQGQISDAKSVIGIVRAMPLIRDRI